MLLLDVATDCRNGCGQCGHLRTSGATRRIARAENGTRSRTAARRKRGESMIWACEVRALYDGGGMGAVSRGTRATAGARWIRPRRAGRFRGEVGGACPCTNVEVASEDGFGADADGVRAGR